MTTIAPTSAVASTAPKMPAQGTHPNITDERDGERFQSMLQQYLDPAKQNSAPQASDHGKTGLSEKIFGRATELASEMKKDHMHVSKMLETAAASGDQMHLMKAMLAIGDYQTRVQFISKTISKASSSLDSLTKMQ